jgi:flagellar hook assembly protein FlgD
MLAPSAPNPFQATTRVAYQLPASGEHRLAIYDVQGRVVRILATGQQPGGQQAVSWDGRDTRGEVTPAGVYFVRLDFGGRTETGKVVLIPSGR